LATRLQTARPCCPPVLGGAPTRPLEVGRSSRVVQAAQPAALAVPDGGWVFPATRPRPRRPPHRHPTPPTTPKTARRGLTRRGTLVGYEPGLRRAAVCPAASRMPASRWARNRGSGSSRWCGPWRC